MAGDSRKQKSHRIRVAWLKYFMTKNNAVFYDFLKSRDFYNAWLAYRLKPVETYAEFEAFRTIICAAIAQPAFYDLQSVGEIPKPPALEPYHEWRRDAMPVKTVI